MRQSILIRACVFALALLCPSLSTPLMQKAAGSEKCDCAPGCDCGPGCRCNVPLPAVPKVTTVPDEMPAEKYGECWFINDGQTSDVPPPPAWVLEKLRQQEGRLTAVETKVARIEDGIARVERLLTERSATASAVPVQAAPVPASDEVMRSIDAKLSMLIVQNRLRPADASAGQMIQVAAPGVAARPPFAQAGTTRPTPAPIAGQVSTASPGGPAAVTYTLAPAAGRVGGTNGGGCSSGGCASGNCGVQQRQRLFGRWR